MSQIVAYQIGIRPTLDYSAAPRPRVTYRLLLAAFNRTVGYGIAAWLCSRFAHQPGNAASFGIRVGLTIGLVTAVSSTCTPLIEWAADHIPEKRMGVFGIGLILVGFSLQSVQYWIALLDIHVR